MNHYLLNVNCKLVNCKLMACLKLAYGILTSSNSSA